MIIGDLYDCNQSFNLIYFLISFITIPVPVFLFYINLEKFIKRSWFVLTFTNIKTNI